MRPKNSVFFSLAAATAVVLGLPSISRADDLNLAVIDVQQCLTGYYKTEQRVEEVNKQAEEHRKEIDARQADYQKLTTKAGELNKTASDTALSAENRQAAVNELQQVLQERAGKAREIEETKRKAQAVIFEARQKMELELVTDVKNVADSISAAKNIDLLIDKSFLPRANKVLVYTSAKVPDVTEDVTKELNKEAPEGWTPKPVELPGTDPVTGATGEAGSN